MGAPVHVIGLGVANGARLSASAEQALAEASAVIGSPRQLELLDGLGVQMSAERHELPKLAELDALLDRLSDAPLCVLASGDPLFYGIGRWLTRHTEPARLHFYPAVSSIQAMCHRVGLSLQDCRVVSLHGRPLSGLNRELKRNRDLVILTDRHSHPRALAEACVAANFGDSCIHVGEDLGGPDERLREFGAAALATLPELDCSALNVCVIRVRGPGGVLPEFPGIDDRAFASDGAPGEGMFTKREVRLAILALLQPGDGDVIWDIGAGCGGVASSLAHWNARVSVHAIEPHPERRACLEENRRRFGCEANLHIVDGRAPAVLDALPAANKVFIGGSDGELDAILAAAWPTLPDGGLLVASAVTADTNARLQAFAAQLDPAQVETLRVAVSRGEVSANGIDYHAKHPVTLYRFVSDGGER